MESKTLTNADKQKLEKLIFADIDRVAAQSEARYQTQRREVDQQLEKNPPANVQAIYAQFGKLNEQLDGAKAKLDKLGYRVGYQDKLVTSTNPLPPELAKLDEARSKRKEKLDGLKRSYTVKLFTGAAQADELLTALAKELSRITEEA